MLNEWIKEWLCPCPQTFFLIILCLSYFISLRCTVLNIILIRNSLRSTGFFFEKKLIAESDCFKFISSAFLLAPADMKGCRNGDRLGEEMIFLGPGTVGSLTLLTQWGSCTGRWNCEDGSQGDERRVTSGREDGFQVNPGLFQEFISRKLRTPFLSCPLGKKEGS